jgi:cytochrome c5
VRFWPLVRLAFIVPFVAGLAASAAQNPAPAAKSKSAATAPQPKGSPNASAEGEKRFATHCGRCHVPPEDLSPREAKAVLRQMRIKAGLSAEDERLILKYLAP